MSILTKNKSTLYSKNIYRYQFKGLVENKEQKKIVALLDKETNEIYYKNLNELRSDEFILNQIEPATAFDLGWETHSILPTLT